MGPRRMGGSSRKLERRAEMLACLQDIDVQL